MRNLIFIWLFFAFFSPEAVFAQEKKEVVYKGAGSDLQILKKFPYPKALYDSLPTKLAFKGLITALHKEGYLLATVDSLAIKEKEVATYLTIGERFTWAHLTAGNLGESMLNGIGYREKFFRDKPFKYNDAANLLEKIISYAENNGFPFAQVTLDSITIDKNAIKASINYESGPLITFDTVEISGNTKTKPLFLSHYLSIRPGSYYEERKVKYAIDKIKRLPYVKITAPPYVSFQLKQGTPHVGLTEVKANQVDGIIGLLPNEGKDNKPLITGQFNLLLQNMFGTGKIIALQWQRPQINSQNLKVQYSHPNLLKSPVSIKASFFLLKEDTSFLNRDLLLEASLFTGKFGTAKVFGDFKVSRTISTGSMPKSMDFTGYADFNLNQYGAGYNFTHLDDNINPTNGLTFEIQGSVGSKKIRATPGTADSISLSVVQYNFEGAFNYYYPLSKRVVLRSKLLAGSIVSNHIFVNDLYRLGGLKSLRGFVENEFYASDYAIGTVEGQFYLDSSSYLFLFYDQGYIKTGTGPFKSDFPAGLGSGISLTTNAGVFTFVYALGKTSSQPFSVNFSKIHFGYITRF